MISSCYFATSRKEGRACGWQRFQKIAGALFNVGLRYRETCFRQRGGISDNFARVENFVRGYFKVSERRAAREFSSEHPGIKIFLKYPAADPLGFSPHDLLESVSMLLR